MQSCCLAQLSACLHEGGVPQVGEVTCGGSPHLTCKGDHIKMRDYMDRGVTSPIWGTPPPCKQALNLLLFCRSDSRHRRRCLSSLLGILRSDDGDGNGNATKAIGLISKTTILHVHHAFLYISLPSLHDYDVKMPNFTMYRGITQATTKFPLSFCTWIWFLGIQL